MDDQKQTGMGGGYAVAFDDLGTLPVCPPPADSVRWFERRRENVPAGAPIHPFTDDDERRRGSVIPPYPDLRAMGAEIDAEIDGATHAGTVRWFDDPLGFGFIARDDGGPDVFVRQTQIAMRGHRTLTEGQSVTFVLSLDPHSGRFEARYVTVT